MHFEQHELHGNLMKGFLHGILTAFCQGPFLAFETTRFAIALEDNWIQLDSLYISISKWTPTIWQFMIRLRLLSHSVLAVCRDCRVARDSECSIWNSRSAEHRIPPVASARSKILSPSQSNVFQLSSQWWIRPCSSCPNLSVYFETDRKGIKVLAASKRS